MEEKKSFFARIHNEGFTWKDSVFITIILSFVVGLLGSVACIPFDFLFSALSNGGSNNLMITLGMYLSTIGIWLVILIFLLVYKSNRPILKAMWTGIKGNNIKMLLLGFLVGFAMNSICIVAAILHRDIFIYYDSFQVIPLALLFIAVFIQSSAEEALCRCFIYQRLRKGYKNPWVAILVNPLLFACMHLANPGMTVVAALNIFVVGVLFGLMVYYFDSLWMAMAAHTAWNFTQNIIFGLPNSGIVTPYSIFKLDAATARNSIFYDVDFGIEATVMALIVLTASTLIAIYIGERKRISFNVRKMG